MNYEECLLLPPEERRKVAGREILIKIKDGTLDSENILYCQPTINNRIICCAVGAFSAYKYHFSWEEINTNIRLLGDWYDVMKQMGFNYNEYRNLLHYFEQEMMGSNKLGSGIRTQNLERVFEFIAATGRIPSVMDHTIPEGE